MNIFFFFSFFNILSLLTQIKTKLNFKPLSSNDFHSKTIFKNNRFLKNNQSFYRSLYNCYETCLTCDKKGDESNHLCTKCLEGYFSVPTKPGQCVKKCEDKYFLDEGVCKKCYTSCLECKKSGSNGRENCEVCNYPYQQIGNTPSKCVSACNFGQFWEINSELSEITCLDRCSGKNFLLIPQTNQCVSNCKDPQCFYCKTKELYEYKNVCYLECPKGTSINEALKKCIDPSPEEKEFTIDTRIDLEKFLTVISNYVEIFNGGQNNRIIIKGINFISRIYNVNEFVEKEYLENKIHVNSLNCQREIRENCKNNEESKNCEFNLSEILTIEIELFRGTEISPQYEYLLVTKNSEILNLDICQKNNKNIFIYYPISDTYILPYDKIIQAKNKGIDLLDPNDSFFNDPCLTTENDITLKLRRDFFLSFPLCENNCTYETIYDKDKLILCKCLIKTSVATTTTPNPKSSLLKSNSISLFLLSKCYKKMFSNNLINLLKNVGFEVYLGIFVLYGVSVIFCIFKGFITPFPLISNPQRKRNEQEELDTQNNEVQCKNAFNSKRNVYKEYNTPDKLSISSKRELIKVISNSNNSNTPFNIKKKEDGLFEDNPINIYTRNKNYSKKKSMSTEGTFDYEEFPEFMSKEERIFNLPFFVISELNEKKKISVCLMYKFYIITHQPILYIVLFRSFLEPMGFRVLFTVSEMLLMCIIHSLFFLSNWYMQFLYKRRIKEKANYVFVLKYGWISIIISLVVLILYSVIIKWLILPTQQMIATIDGEKKKVLQKSYLKIIVKKYKRKMFWFIVLMFLLMITFSVLMIIFFQVFIHSEKLFFAEIIISYIIYSLIPFISGIICSYMKSRALKNKSKTQYNIFKI